ncbi:MAG: hypothetical protein MJ126_04595 [Lachnospiraceae bacterium]|nr:hypothetical protein [Lachnospiraceae bacterium]
MINLVLWNLKTKKGINVIEKRTPAGIEKSISVNGRTFTSPDDIRKIYKLIQEAENINKSVFAEDIATIKAEADFHNIDFEEVLKDYLVAIDEYVAYYMYQEAEENYIDLHNRCPV